jgi:hypothetical protein
VRGGKEEQNFVGMKPIVIWNSDAVLHKKWCAKATHVTVGRQSEPAPQQFTFSATATATHAARIKQNIQFMRPASMPAFVTAAH